jgi:hypothetical protein
MTVAGIAVGANTGEVMVIGVATTTGIATIIGPVELTRVPADRAVVAAVAEVATTAAVAAEMVAPIITGSVHTAVIGNAETALGDAGR